MRWLVVGSGTGVALGFVLLFAGLLMSGILVLAVAVVLLYVALAVG